MKIIKRRVKGGFKLICSAKEAQAIGLLLNTSCTLQAVQKIFPGVFPTSGHPFRTCHLDEFKRAGVEISDFPTGKKYPNKNPVTFCGSLALTHEIGKWGDKYSWRVIKSEPTCSLQPYLNQ